MAGSFGDLLSKAGLQGSPEAEKEADAPATEAVEGMRFAAKVVLRRTRKGRGGRTVTLIQGIESGHEEVAKRAKKLLGTGARVEEDEVVVQGDQVERLAGWLEGLEGVRKVVKS